MVWYFPLNIYNGESRSQEREVGGGGGMAMGQAAFTGGLQADAAKREREGKRVK